MLSNIHQFYKYIIYYIIMELLPSSINWFFLSKNRNLTLDFFIENLDKKWDMFSISSHPIITLNVVFNYPLIEWDITGLLRNENITNDEINLLKQNDYNVNGIDFIERIFKTTINDDIRNKLENIIQINKSKNITVYNFDLVVNNINKNWDWSILTNRLPVNFILQNINYNWACFDPFIKPDKFISYYNEHSNDNINWTWDFIFNFINESKEYDGWNWEFFSLRAFNETNYNKYPNFPWNYKIIINANPYINFPFVSSNLELFQKYDNSNLDFLYRLPDISWDIVRQNNI